MSEEDSLTTKARLREIYTSVAEREGIENPRIVAIDDLTGLRAEDRVTFVVADRLPTSEELQVLEETCGHRFLVWPSFSLLEQLRDIPET